MEKQKLVIEYDLKGVPLSMLWQQIATASGLATWFADTVEIDGRHYTFGWDGGGTQQARLVSMRTMTYVRWRWADSEGENGGTGGNDWWELRMSRNAMTDATTLTVTDHAADEADRAEVTALWDQQIDTLRRVLGV